MSSAIPDIVDIPLADAARFLRVTPARLRELADAGEIPCERGGVKLPLIGTIGAAAEGTFKFSDLMKHLQAQSKVRHPISARRR